MKELDGYAGKMLRVDLSSGEVTEFSSSPYLPKYLGGRGLAARLYWDEIKRETEPFDPDNKLIFVPGGLNSTGAVGASKSYLTSKSPYQYPCHSFHCTEASNVGPQIKRAGYDALIIEGKAYKPVYLHIYNGKVEILDAQEYWGQGTCAVRNALLEKHGGNVVVSCIGPAGENLAVQAGIFNSCSSVFARGGFGAVFGSKNLKAIVIGGTGRIKVSDPFKLLEVNKKRASITEIKVGEEKVVDGRKIKGEMDPPWQSRGLLPFLSGSMVEAAKRGEITFKKQGCEGCPYHCRTMIKFADGSSTLVVKCAGAFGGAHEISAAAAANNTKEHLNMQAAAMNIMDAVNQDVVDFWRVLIDLGFDIMQLICINGQTEPITLEDNTHEHGLDGGDWLSMLHEAGILNEENTGLPYNNGKYHTKEWLIKLCEIIAYRKGFGDILAQGPGPATEYIVSHEEFGPDRAKAVDIYHRCCPKAGPICSHDFKHAMYTPNPVRSIYAAVSDRVGNNPEPYWFGTHNEVPSESPEVIEKWFGGSRDILDYYAWNIEQVKAAIAHEDNAMLTDSIGTCTYIDHMQRKVLRMSMAREPINTVQELLENSPNGGPEYLSAVTGETVTYEELIEQAKASVNMVRACWVRDGYTETGVFDTFWDIQFEVRNRETGALGLPKEKFEKAIQDYYGLRGWINGVPTRDTLEHYGLQDVADELEERGLLQG